MKTQCATLSTKARIDNRQWAVIGIVLLALALRLALWSQPLHKPANDEVEYITVAHDLLLGRGWIFYDTYHWLRAPLYPLFLAASLWLARGNLHLAALPNIGISVATVYLIYRLTDTICHTPDLLQRSRSGPRLQRYAPLLAALFAAVLFTFNTFASLYMSETLFSFLFAAFLICLVQWQRYVVSMPDRRSQWWSLLKDQRLAFCLLAGILFGLATLTRSAMLAFLPIVLGWMGYMTSPGHLQQRHCQPTPGNDRRLPGDGIIVALCILLTIAPWTLRNCHAYERCILVETGLSYNVWAFNEPIEDQETILRTLEQIPDPALRAEEATRRGLERLRTDPAILLRKLWPEWVNLWRVKIIEDRFLLADYTSDPPPGVFLASLLLDDLLYLTILIAGVLGMGQAVRYRHPGAILCILWSLYIIATIVLTHGEGRYRHFLFSVLIPFAAIALLQAGERWNSTILQRQPGETLQTSLNLPFLFSSLLSVLLLYTVIIHYPWEWARKGSVVSLYRLAGQVALAQGNLEQAALAYQHALATSDTPDTWIALGHMYRRQGDYARAEAAYRSAWQQDGNYIPAMVHLGDVLRAQGHTTEARKAFTGRYVFEQAVIDWSWHNLLPPPATHIDVGNDLDFGYVSGVYPDETQQGTSVRWTRRRALFRLNNHQAIEHTTPPATPLTALPRSVLVQLRLAAPHPDTETVTATVCMVDTDRCQPIAVEATWRVFSLLLPDDTNSSALIELRSPTFDAPDGRALGMLVDWITIAAQTDATVPRQPQAYSTGYSPSTTGSGWVSRFERTMNKEPSARTKLTR